MAFQVVRKMEKMRRLEKIQAHIWKVQARVSALLWVRLTVLAKLLHAHPPFVLHPSAPRCQMSNKSWTSWHKLKNNAECAWVCLRQIQLPSYVIFSWAHLHQMRKF